MTVQFTTPKGRKLSGVIAGPATRPGFVVIRTPRGAHYVIAAERVSS